MSGASVRLAGAHLLIRIHLLILLFMHVNLPSPLQLKAYISAEEAKAERTTMLQRARAAPSSPAVLIAGFPPPR